jgi:hypothetical protein
MAWLICRAVLRCQRRRAGVVLRSAPLAGGLLVALAAAAPFALARVGGALGGALQPALADVDVARALTLAPVLAGSACGAAVGVASVGRHALGQQLAAGPVGARAALLACVLAPAGVLAACCLPAALGLTLPLGSASPGGAVAGVGIVGAALAAAPWGAVLSEAVVQLGGGATRLIVVVIPTAAVWAGIGVALGAPALGPLALVAASLAGNEHPAEALGAAALTGCAGTAAWLELAARRPERRARVRGFGRCRVAGPLVTALPLSAGVLLARRRDLRFGLLAAVAFGLGGVALAQSTGAPAPAPLQLGVSSALLGAALVPLAVGGALLAGRWTWVCAPRHRLLPCAALCTASAMLLSTTAGGVAVVAGLVSGAPSRALIELGLVAVLVAAAATLAGAIVPWRGITMGDQVASFGAFAAAAGGLSAAAGFAGPRLVAAGLPDAAAAVWVLVSMSVLGVGALVVRLRRDQ